MLKRLQSLAAEAFALCRDNMQFVAVGIFVEMLSGMLIAHQSKPGAAPEDMAHVGRYFLVMGFAMALACTVTLAALDIVRRAKKAESVHLADSMVWGLRRLPRFTVGLCKFLVITTWPMLALFSAGLGLASYKVKPSWSALGRFAQGEGPLGDVAAWGEHVPTLAVIGALWALAIVAWFVVAVFCQLTINIYLMEGTSTREAMRRSVSRIRGNVSVPIFLMVSMWIPQLLDAGLNKILLMQGVQKATIPGVISLALMPYQALLAAVIYFHLTPVAAPSPMVDEPSITQVPPALPTA